jgi:dihydrofolate reductase
MKLSLIVAMSTNGVIGQGDKLPWHLSTDLRRFKRLTMGHHIVMGRKTFESIGQLLPGRTTIVLTRQAGYRLPGGLVAHDLSQALQLASADDQLFVIGGGEIFGQALPLADRLYVTRVHAHVQGDVHFPEVDWGRWRLLERQQYQADERNDFESTFSVYAPLSDREAGAASGPLNGKG